MSEDNLNAALAAILQSNLSQPEVKEEVKAAAVTAKVSVEVEKTDHGQKTVEVLKNEKSILEPRFVRPRSIYISVDSGATISLGNFNMAKVNVSISMPVGTEITPELRKEIDAAYQFAHDYCDQKVANEVNEMVKARRG